MKDKIVKVLKDSYAGIFVSLCLSYMLLFYEPLNIFSSNLGDFWFDFYDFFPIVLFQFLLAFFILSLFFIIIRLINKKIYAFFVFCFLIGTICTYIQGNFLAGSLPAIDGTWIDFDKFKTEKMISLGLWIVVLGIMLFVLLKYKFKVLEKISMYASIVIILMLSSSFIVILTKDDFFENRDSVVATYKNFNDLSNNKNFIIFLVDATDSKTFETELKKLDKEEIFNDFTYYPDTLGGYPFTRNSIPFIFSGKWYENEKKFGTYLTDALNNSELFEELENKNYELSLYEQDLIGYQLGEKNKFSNLSNSASISFEKLLVEESKMILYKYLPYQLKWRAKIDTLNMDNTFNDVGKNYYTQNNLSNYEKFKNEEVSIIDKNVFKYIHLEGAHVPFKYDKDLNLIESGTYEDNVDACIKLIETYINMLKENNSYDNSVIVIMSDHGYGKLTLRQNPILFIKGFGESHDYKISSTKVSYANLTGAFKDLINEKTTDKLFENIDNTTRRFLYYEYNNPKIIKEYTLEGNAWDYSKLKPTGKEYILK